MAGVAQKVESLIDTAPVVPQQVRTAGGAAEPSNDNSWAAGGTDRGTIREDNEDSFLCDPLRGLFIVADGMGGHAAGEQASAAAIQVFDEVLSAPRIRNALEAAEGGMQDLLAEALQQANNSIRDFGKERLHLAGMGSTAVIGVLGEGIFHVANIGDSRAYLARGEGAQILTKDHSVAAAMCEQGQLTAEEARHHPLRNHLTASLGSTRPVRPHYQATPVLPGDRIVLCSDGLWDMLPDAQIASLALAAPTPQAAVRALLQAANDAGGLDNITVIAVAIPASNEGQEMPWARDAAASSG